MTAKIFKSWEVSINPKFYWVSLVDLTMAAFMQDAFMLQVKHIDDQVKQK